MSPSPFLAISPSREPRQPRHGERRQFAREDVLKYAADDYREKGALADWTVDDFIESGEGRFPYDMSLIDGVVGDLLMGHKLTGTMGAKPRLHLAPEAYADGLPDETDEQIRSWLRRLTQHNLAPEQE